jgi:hypothetical protein
MATLVGSHNVRTGTLLVAMLDVVGERLVHERLEMTPLALGKRAHLL